MSDEVARRSVDVLLEDGPADEPAHLHFFGGEPLLNFALLQRTVLYAEERAAELGREITFEVTTNGTRLEEDVVAFLDEHRVQVGVSFDGPPEVQDVARPAASGSSHALAVPGIRRLLASRAGTDLEERTHCSVVVTRRSADLVGIVRHLEELGFRKIVLTPATDVGVEAESSGFRDEDLPELLAAYDALAAVYEADLAAGRRPAANWFPTLMGRLLSGERRSTFCDGGRDYLGVAADGRVNLCYRFYEDDEFAMGSVQAGIDRAVTERLDAHGLESRTACSTCWARSFCGGGCHHENVHAGGGLGEPNPITCDVFRHSMGRTLEAWARLTRAGHLPGRVSPATDANGATMNDTNDGGFPRDARPRCVDGCHVRELDGEKVVYDPRTHEVSVLNPTAAFIFELCDGEHSVEEILEALAARYDAPRDVLGQDLDGVLVELAGKSLVA
jgi:uncharacterized protein